jgi:hypothetical protein
MRSYGRESRDWIGREIELYIGATTYQGREQESVLVKPISPPIPVSGRKGLKTVEPLIDDDDISF